MKLTIYVKSLLQILLIALLCWLVYTVRGVLIYIFIASVLTLVLKPLVNSICSLKIKNKSLPRSLVSGLMVLLLFTTFGIITMLVFPALISEFSVLSKIDFGQVYKNSVSQIHVISAWLPPETLNVSEIINEIKDALGNILSLSNLESTVASILGGLGSIAIALFSIIFILFFLLNETNITRYIISNYLQEKTATHIINILPKIKTTLFRYSVGLMLQMTGIFLIVYIGLNIIGVESALVIAVFASFINLIPYLGPVIGFVFGMTLGLGQALALTPDANIGLLAIEIAAVFAVAQLMDNFISQPLIFSNSINAHPLEIFIIISVAGLLGGVLAMIIAVPTYSMIRIISKEFFTKSHFIQSFTKNV